MVNESPHVGPEVTFILGSFPFACNGKRLTWTGTGPHGAGVGPLGEAEGVGPPSHPGKQVDLLVTGEGFGLEFLDGGVIDGTGGKHAEHDKGLEPFAAVWVNIVVESKHG